MEASGGATAFHGAWPYIAPPEGHFNFAAQPYAGVPTVILGDGPYRDLLVPPSALWLWADKKWEYLIAESHELDADAGTLTLKIKPDLTWSDGSALTSQDYLTSFYLQFIQRADLVGLHHRSGGSGRHHRGGELREPAGRARTLRAQEQHPLHRAVRRVRRSCEGDRRSRRHDGRGRRRDAGHRLPDLQARERGRVRPVRLRLRHDHQHAAHAGAQQDRVRGRQGHLRQPRHVQRRDDRDHLARAVRGRRLRDPRLRPGLGEALRVRRLHDPATAGVFGSLPCTSTRTSSRSSPMCAPERPSPT